MSDLRNNIHRYMDIKQIKYYSDLLIMIGKELKVKDPYKFAEKEKSNFSKMLKEERPLKHEFIIPLEKIFGVSMARLMDDGAYSLPLNKEDMPYIKGFRYYAYKDDPKLYEDEFERTMITNDGFPTICNSDEFNKFFLDYVIEYRSINALKFLLHKHNLRGTLFSFNSLVFDDHSQLFTSMPNQLFNMVIQEDDVELFEQLFKTVEMIIQYNMPIEHLKLGFESFEFLLNSDKIFKSLFIPKEYSFKDFNRGIIGHEQDKIILLNPLLSECLNYALNNLDKYKEKAKEILLFAVEYNEKAIELTNETIEALRIGENGCVYYGSSYELLTSIVSPEFPIEDKELKELVDKLVLPKYLKGY